jgi:hypothetical protein
MNFRIGSTKRSWRRTLRAFAVEADSRGREGVRRGKERFNQSEQIKPSSGAI